MKKVLFILIAIILIIAIIIAAKNNINGLKTEYEIENVEKYVYVKYRDDDKYGIMDRNGEKITDAEYFKIEIPNPEKDIFICYKDEENAVVLDSNKQELFQEYNKIEPIKLKNIASLLCYEKNVLKYQKDGKYGIIDFNGTQITKNDYDEIENLQGTEGKFLIKKDGKYGIINLNGSELIAPKYDEIQTDGYYNEETKYVEAGFIVSETTNDGYRYGYINSNGKKILNVEYNDIVRISDKKEIYLIAAKNGKYGLYKEKKELIKPEYQSISYTDNGSIIIEKNAQFGIADIKGNIKVATKYDQINENGIYVYAQNTKENDVYSVDGEKIDINFNKTVYDTESPEYRITTLLNNNITYYGVEDKKGETLVDMSYPYIEYIYADYFITQDEKEKYGVIRPNGKYEIDSEYDLIQKIKNKNIIQASNRGSKKVDFYSLKLKKSLSMDSAKVENKENYIKIYNDKETKYLDKDGNEITEDSDIIKAELSNELPKEIGEYKKYQYSLDDVYYTK